MSIAPDHAAHAALEAEVDEYLRSRGYLTFAAPYHETFPADMRDLLQRRNTWTALHLRGRADRLAIHTTLPSDFEWEVKTHDNPGFSDLCLELLPFLHHRAKTSLAVQCMYVFRIPHAGTEGAFWVKNRPPVRTVYLTPRLPANGRKTFETRVKDALPEAKVVHRERTKGSGDPYLVIDVSEAKRCDHWRVLVDKELERASR